MTSNISKTIKETFERTREEERIEIAIEMLKDGEPIAKIAKYSKLSENEILELRKKL